MRSMFLDSINSKDEDYQVIHHTTADHRSKGKSILAPALLKGKSLIIKKHYIMIESILGHQGNFKNKIQNIESLKQHSLVKISFDLHAGLNNLMNMLRNEILFVKNHDHFALLVILHTVDEYRVAKITKFAIVDLVSQRCIFKPAITI